MNINLLKRRSVAVAAALVGAGLVLASCGSDNGDDSPKENPVASTDAAFPATVTGEFGDITVKEKPANIVVVGDYRAVDALNSLGEKPVFGTSKNAEADFLKDNPWMEGLYSEYDQEMIDADWKPDPEAISLADPDLIIGNMSVDDGMYAKLSAIAPTYVPRDGNNISWQDTITQLGALVGQGDRAKKVIGDTEKTLAETREKLSGLKGATYNEFFVGGDSTVSLFPPEDGQLLHILGLENAGQKQDDFKKVSLENISELNADVFLVRGGQYGTAEDRQKLESDPRYGQLPAVKNNAVLLVETDVADAIGAVRPAALAWVLPRILPLLEKITVNSRES